MLRLGAPTPPHTHTHLLISSPFFPPYACSNSALLHWCGRKNDLFGTLLLAAGLRETVQRVSGQFGTFCFPSL